MRKVTRKVRRLGHFEHNGRKEAIKIKGFLLRVKEKAAKNLEIIPQGLKMPLFSKGSRLTLLRQNERVNLLTPHPRFLRSGPHFPDQSEPLVDANLDSELPNQAQGCFSQRSIIHGHLKYGQVKFYLLL